MNDDGDGTDYEGTSERASHVMVDTCMVGPAYENTYTSGLVHQCET